MEGKRAGSSGKIVEYVILRFDIQTWEGRRSNTGK